MSTGRRVLRTSAWGLAALTALVAAMIAVGGPSTPPPMASINAPFAHVDMAGLPPLSRYTASDGAALAYRHYPSVGAAHKGAVVLVHGSSAHSASMHVLAQALAKAGYDAYALDIRGHGASGTKGHIDHIGQLEDDLSAFVKAVPLARPATLAGFSSGGGFALRFAGSDRQDAFQRYLLLAPFLGPDAPSARPDSGGWVKVGIPRIVGLSVLNGLGIRAFNDLDVIRYALSDSAKAKLTPAYGFDLTMNFMPQRDLAQNIRAVHQPLAVVAGVRDEAFKTEAYEAVFRQQGQRWPVTLVPGVGHVTVTLEPEALKAIVQTLDGFGAAS